MTTKRQGADVYPHYEKVTAAKLDCLPPPSTITYTETKAVVTLQGLVDKTIQRIIEFFKLKSAYF